MKDFKIYTQISTSHSSEANLTPADVRARLAEVREILPLSGLILGSYENKAVFRELTLNKRHDDPEVYLWYNLLSDYPEQDPAESVITVKGNSCKKWFGWGEDAAEDVSESFLFSCPNHPVTGQKTLKGLSKLIETYPFDGVFLDKFRFPSPANGLDLTLSCFCPHCYEKAAAMGLDLDAVRAELLSLNGSRFGRAETTDGWIRAVLEGRPLLQQFAAFRVRSVLDIVGQVETLVRAKGMKLGLDLFSPAYALLVGYDYPELAKHADWFKPMTYQFAMGPAGLRLETISLVDEICSEYGVTEAALFEQCAKSLPWFTPEKYAQLKGSEVPMEWIRSEMAAAVRQTPDIPVCFGLECVRFPEVIDVRPEQAAALMRSALESGGNGVVLSWDLMHMPNENLRAMRSVIDGRA